MSDINEFKSLGRDYLFYQNRLDEIEHNIRLLIREKIKDLSFSEIKRMYSDIPECLAKFDLVCAVNRAVRNKTELKY